MLKRLARSLVDRIVRGSLAPVEDRAARLQSRLDDVESATEARARAAERIADETKLRVDELRGRIDQGASTDEVLRRDLDHLRVRVRDWNMGDRLKQLSAIQRDQVSLNAALKGVVTRLARLEQRIEAHKLGDRMGQLSALQREVDTLAGLAHSADARLDRIRRQLGGADLSEHLRELARARAEIDTLIDAQRGAAARHEELRSRLDGYNLGERMAQLSRLERLNLESSDALRALEQQVARAARERAETERRLTDLLDRVERWGLGDRVHQVSRIEGELRAHADVQRRLEALLRQIAEHASPEIAWLYANREERMDAHSGLWREDRRALHLARYLFASRRVRGMVVADVACGTGYGSRALADGGAARVLAFDADHGAVDYARARYASDSVEFGVADARALPLEDATLDAFVSFETIEHLPDPERFVDEIARVLKPGGVLILSTPNDWGLEHAAYHAVSLDLASVRRLLAERFEIDEAWGQAPPDDPDTVLRADAPNADPPGFARIEDDAGDADCLVLVARLSVAAPRALTSEPVSGTGQEH